MRLIEPYLYFPAHDSDEENTIESYEGESVIINCNYDLNNYDRIYSNNTKSFCKIKDKSCITVSNTTENRRDVKGKFFSVDDIQSGVYSMLIRNLIEDDEGTYRCDVENQQKPQLTVELDVETGEILYLGLMKLLYRLNSRF